MLLYLQSLFKSVRSLQYTVFYLLRDTFMMQELQLCLAVGIIITVWKY